ncbi:MAG: molybdate ABC transporter permease subunit [Deltaproteobacteria bacterium]|nr:MAG: molybdate ABC transporter permease subunit [Deltaproteobacteria bacterium]
MPDLFPIFLSFRIAMVATIISFAIGIPLGYLLAKKSFPGKDLMDSVITFPIILPPTVLGYYLLVVIGNNSPLGRFIQEDLGIELIFNWKGAVLAAATVSMPFLIKYARASFEGVSKNLEDVARTLGYSELGVFFRVTLPLAWRGIAVGTTLAFARALGEFGATLIVAGNIYHKTQTAPIAIFDAVQMGRDELANMMVLIMSGIAFTVVFLTTKLGRSRYE